MFSEVLSKVFGGKVRFGGGVKLTSTYRVEGGVCGTYTPYT